ncbi:hypothetical protein K7X08_019780 [Anisodus acutangulus]|uniref:Uncharacterized protein n=1 Tax=Anisodus acutangulus TaxID=402998 RepID=A0A9Q1MY54_9SOLA|nr:hypothetical protein K7X08_019780 [Anisodus acutangulus]
MSGNHMLLLVGWAFQYECESYIQRETDLKCTIEELEKELEDTKKKSFELSSRLESQKKLKLLKQLGRKA